MAMMLWSLHVLLALLSAHGAQAHRSSEGAQGLSCVNDFVNNVSCTWNGAPLAPGVDCWIIGVKKIRTFKDNDRYPDQLIRSCKLKQYREGTPGCSFVFENEGFRFLEVMPNISMECNGTLVEILIHYKPSYHIKMNPPGVPNVSRTSNETWISWSPGSPLSNLIKSFDFHVQIKQKKQSWKEARNLSTQDQELRIFPSPLKGYYKVRVRVKPSKMYNGDWSHWSNWSPTTTWLEETDSQNQDWLLVIRIGCFTLALLGILLLMLFLYWSWMSKRRHKRKPVPNPSKYFHTLHSVHGGNLKKWLNPLSASGSFFTTQPCDKISPVEVCISWDEAPSTSPSSSSTSALLHFSSYPSAGSETSGIAGNSSSSSSFFSNMGYFMSSSSSSSARTHPSPAYFTYQDDFHDLKRDHSLHFSLVSSSSPAYESLKREPQSPDSGFGIGKEDEQDSKGVRGVDVEDEEVSGDHLRSPLLIFPLHHPSQMCPPCSAPAPPHPRSQTQNSPDTQQVDVPAAAAGDSYAARPVAGAMCRSSSMPDEPCRTGYLTLKELQTTFSNKSI